MDVDNKLKDVADKILDFIVKEGFYSVECKDPQILKDKIVDILKSNEQ